MNGRIGADPPYTRGGVTITPIFRSRTTLFCSGGMGEKVPLGLLIHADTRLCIVSFTGSYTWWDELADAYPDLRDLHPVFREHPPEPQKK